MSNTILCDPVNPPPFLKKIKVEIDLTDISDDQIKTMIKELDKSMSVFYANNWLKNLLNIIEQKPIGQYR